MKVTVHIKPNARKSQVDALPDGALRVAVCAPAVDGKANDALIETLSKHFKVAKSRITILRGHTARIKTVEIG